MRSAGARGETRSMLQPAVTALAPRPRKTPAAEGRAVSTLSRFLRMLLARARADERRRIARDLHDGAQQRLVHTVLALKLAQQVSTPATRGRWSTRRSSRPRPRTRSCVSCPRHPPVGLATGCPPVCGRWPNARRCRSTSRCGRPAARRRRGGRLLRGRRGAHQCREARTGRRGAGDRPPGGRRAAVEVSDDGVGGADPNGDGLVGLRDRVVALDGEFEVTPAGSSGTRIAAAIPLPR